MSWQFDLASAIGGRPVQQDRVALFDVPWHDEARLVVLADGMGGQADGDLAAQAVLDTADAVLADVDPDTPQRLLEALCHRAHDAIIDIGRRRRSTPGSTCVLLYLLGDDAYWAHVGDSRLYHFAGRELLTQTRDHTVGELLKDLAGPPAAADAPAGSAGLLYMCLGGQNAVEPDFGASATAGDDWFLLCSDGLCGQVGAAELARLHRDDNLGAADLVDLATQRGGVHGDNVSVALVTRRANRLARAWRRVRRTGR